MRIDAYSQIQQVYGTHKYGNVKKSEKTGRASDQLQLSSIGKDIQTVKNAVAEAPDIREDLVAPLRQAIQNGTYSVDTGAFAAKLAAKYQEMKEV